MGAASQVCFTPLGGKTPAESRDNRRPEERCKPERAILEPAQSRLLFRTEFVFHSPPEQERLGRVGEIFRVGSKGSNGRKRNTSGQTFHRASQLVSDLDMVFVPGQVDDFSFDDPSRRLLVTQKTNGPDPNVGIRMVEQVQREFIGEPTHGVQSP